MGKNFKICEKLSQNVINVTCRIKKYFTFIYYINNKLTYIYYE